MVDYLQSLPHFFPAGRWGLQAEELPRGPRIPREHYQEAQSLGQNHLLSLRGKISAVTNEVPAQPDCEV